MGNCLQPVVMRFPFNAIFSYFSAALTAFCSYEEYQFVHKYIAAVNCSRMTKPLVVSAVHNMLCSDVKDAGIIHLKKARVGVLESKVRSRVNRQTLTIWIFLMKLPYQ